MRNSTPFGGDSRPRTLVVDLDGTLLKSDMLYETFWSAVATGCLNLIAALRALLTGKSALKRYLVERSSVDVATLPYNPCVLQLIRDWRSGGGEVALVTATHDSLAKRIATHLGLFDHVQGTTDAVNLKGEHKARFLLDRFPQGFAYAGDSRPDLQVWQASEHAITVNAPRSLRDQVDSLGIAKTHLAERDGLDLKAALLAMRPHQWLKNALIFVPLLAAHKFEGAAVFTALVAFVAFSLIASGIYIINDLFDLRNDRAHPRKRLRPLASGELCLLQGSILSAASLGTGLLLALSINWQFVVIVLFYLALTTYYSLSLKKLVMVDIIVLALLYTTRLLAGGIATMTPLSEWLLIFSLFFFLSLAAIKRQAELLDSEERGAQRTVGRGYITKDLQVIAQFAVTSGLLSILVMALYLKSPEVIARYEQPSILLGACVVLLYWLLRMIMATHRGMMHDDPIVFSARDRTSYLCLALIAVLFIYATQ
ncbi:MAG: UbiA family prenyltransferase [Pseudomonadota bacterium]